MREEEKKNRRRKSTYTPDFPVVPVDDGVDAHEARPVRVRLVEEAEGGAVGVGPARADEDGLDAGALDEVLGQGGLHGLVRRGQVEVVRGRRLGDECVHLGEGPRGPDVQGL